MVEIHANLANLNHKLKFKGHTRLHCHTINILCKYRAPQASAPSEPSSLISDDVPPSHHGTSLFQAGNMANDNSVCIIEISGQLPLAFLIEMGEPEAFCLAASKDPKTLSWDKAMADPDKDKWLEAAQNKIEALKSNHTWK
jgi:hypothetical protein